MKLKSRIGSFVRPLGENVVTMDNYRKRQTLSPLRQVEAYWTALCDGETVPRRSAIDPRGIDNILRYTFIVERIAPGIARFRVAGQHLQAVTGLDLRGMPLTSVLTPEARTLFQPLCETMFNAPAVLTLHMNDTALPGQAAHMVLLPLRDEFGQVNRAMGAMVGDQDSTGNAARFDINGSELREIGAAEGAYFNSVRPEPVSVFAEKKALFTGEPSYLRVVSTQSNAAE
ncbi:MAG: PAS domain-containing protein [Paracoccaceae bacterium]|jgi:hypothetical protein